MELELCNPLLLLAVPLMFMVIGILPKTDN